MHSVLNLAPVYVVHNAYWGDLFNLTAIMLLSLAPLMLGYWKGGDDK